MNNNKLVNIPFKLGLLAATTHLLLTSPLQAQEAPNKGEDAESMEKIMVTARKRTESLFETPTAITSLGENMLADANIGNIDDIGKYVPNLNISRYGVGNTAHAAVFIRGIGLQDHIITTDPGVGVYLDGVYLGRQMGANMSLPNIERVEVLRGPQGTLYGRNTLGGAVNIITKKPGDENIGTISLKAGSRGRVASDVYLNLDVTDSFSFSASASFKTRDGVGTAVNLDNPEREIGEEEEFSGRFAAKWDVNESFNLMLAVDTIENESGQSPYTIEFTDPLDPNDIFNGDFPLLNPGLIPNDPDDLGTTVDGLESTGHDGWGASLTAEWIVSSAITAKFIGSYRTSDYEGGLDDDASPLNLSEFPETGGADQYSLELQINGVYDNMDFVSGLYFFNEDGFTQSGPWTFSPFNTPDGLMNDGVSPSFGGFGFFDLNQETDAYAIYFNMSYDLSDRMSVGGGVRYSKDEKDADAWFPTFDFLPPVTGRKFVSAEFSEVTWDLNASYQLENGLNVYGQIQKGYQTGGFPPRPFGGSSQFVSFDETTAINYEVGLKGKVTDDLSLLMALFYTEYTDLALPFSDPTAGGGFVTIVENAGESEAQGIEIEATWEPTDNFTIRTAIGYIDAEITKVDAGVIGIGEGDTPALTPDLTVMVAPSYYMELASGASLTFSADYSFRDEMQGQSIFNANELIDDRSLAGFNVKYESEGGDWSLTLYGENIFNEVYDQGRLQQPGYVGIVRSNDRSEFGLRFFKELEL